MELSWPKVNEQKHLCLSLDSKLSLEIHLNEKILKAKNGIGIISFEILVRSHLDYCDIIYHIPGLNNQTNLGVNA